MDPYECEDPYDGIQILHEGSFMSVVREKLDEIHNSKNHQKDSA